VASYTVIAAYRFVDIVDGPVLRQTLLGRAQAGGLKGTVLLAPEGINLSLAGSPAAVSQWLQALQADPRFVQLELKQHSVNSLPFKKLLVKCKREIIRMNEAGVRPQAGRAPAISAATLQRWLQQGCCDEGRPVVLLDTRNAFEVDAGRFEGALDWRLHSFGGFPAALQTHRDALAGKTVVSYCTGGIRCEKAALWMAQQGVPHVHQLDGGILRYFEQAPRVKGVDGQWTSPHWQGECVVFDERQAVGPDLQAAPHSAGRPTVPALFTDAKAQGSAA
jgi:UPF0176 protein